MPADLQRAFHCERFVGMFGPNGMPIRACLRRQLERKRVGEGAKARWEPREAFCATSCELGRANLASVPEGTATTCSSCGAALVGVEACEVCHPEPALPREKPAASARIWEPGRPDVAIGPPPATSPFTGYRSRLPASHVTDPELAAKHARKQREKAAAAAASELEVEQLEDDADEDLEEDEFEAEEEEQHPTPVEAELALRHAAEDAREDKGWTSAPMPGSA